MTQFNYTSGNVNNLDAGDSLNMLDIKGPLQDIPTFLNSRTFNEDNLPVSLLQRLGLNDASGQKGRGVSVITQTESRTNTAYGTMTTPDQVTGIVLPTNGLITVWFQGTWQNSVVSAGRAAIFLGANQLSEAWAGFAAPQLQECVGPNNAGSDSPLASFYMGLNSNDSTSYSGDATTGQLVGLGGTSHNGTTVGGPCYIFAAAGTYTISVQFKSASGSVTVKNRKLWVKAEGFS